MALKDVFKYIGAFLVGSFMISLITMPFIGGSIIGVPTVGGIAAMVIVWYKENNKED